MSYFFSEWKLQTKAQDISLVIYQLPQLHMESSEVEKEIRRIFYQLREMNDYPVMGHSRNLIASVKPLENWGEIAYRGEPEIRPIRLDSREERRLLESVLITDCTDSLPKDKLFVRGRRIISRKSEIFGSVVVRRYLHFDLQVRTNGEILFGFDLAHDFNLTKTLHDLLTKKSSLVKEGMELFDHTSGRIYLFSKELDQTISDPILDSGESLIEYHKNKYNGRFLHKDISPRTKAVECKSRDGQPLYFIPQFLHPVSRMENINSGAIQHVKMEPNKRTEELILWGKSILQQWKKSSSLKIDALDKGWFLTSTGYQFHKFSSPDLKFGNNKVTKVNKAQQISDILEEDKVFSSPTQPINCHYLIDDAALEELKKLKKMKVPLSEFLSEKSEKLGVSLKVSSYDVIKLTNPMKLRLKLKEIAPTIQSDHLVIFIAKHLNDDFYEAIKQVLGGEYQLNSQVIQLNTVKDKQSRSFAITNILLGIYCKSGIQPWALARPLHADCFIGLDVSHQDNQFVSGVIQVIGQYGEVLWSKPISSSESGEKIHPKSMERIITEALYRYSQKYGRNFSNVVFHRDGKGHESEIQAIDQILTELGIEFDYVSIAKKINRRMAVWEGKQWKNPIGVAFLRKEENLAYLCSTDPNTKMGMAQPIRIWNRTGNMDLKSIVEDIYHLTYMNIHAINKSRLPITTNYADKSSMFYRKEMLPTETELRFGFV